MELQNFFAQDVNGNIVPGALCSLFLPGTTTLATGLQDINNVPMSNPFSADGNALVQFRAPNGAYDLKIEAGAVTNTLQITCADNLQALAELASFLGTHPTAPTVRTDSTPLQLGDRYFNSGDDLEYLYKSTGWEPNNLDGALIAAPGGSSLVGVQQTGSGAAIRNGQDKFRESITPQDYLAVGDGITNDDAHFADLEAIHNGREIDLLGLTYLVTAIPTANTYFGGFFKIGVVTYPALWRRARDGSGVVSMGGAGPLLPPDLAMGTNQFGYNNSIFIAGSGALENAINAKQTIAIGPDALYQAIESFDNTALGEGGLYSLLPETSDYSTTLVKGTRNVAIGGNAARSATTSRAGVYIGRNVASSVEACDEIVAIGANALGGEVYNGWYPEVENFDPNTNVATQISVVGAGAAKAYTGIVLLASGHNAALNLKKGNNNVITGTIAGRGLESLSGLGGKVRSDYPSDPYVTYTKVGSVITVTAPGHAAVVGGRAQIYWATGGPAYANHGHAFPVTVTSVPVPGSTFTVDCPYIGDGSGNARLYWTTSLVDAPMSQNNVINGSQAASETTTGNGGAINGAYAGRFIPSYSNITLNGFQAGMNLSVGVDSLVVVGSNALRDNTASVGAVTAIGHNAGLLMQDGSVPSISVAGSTMLGSNSRVSGTSQVQLGGAGSTPYAQAALQIRSDERDKIDFRPLTKTIEFLRGIEWCEFRKNERGWYFDEVVDENGNTTWVEVENDGSRAGTRFHAGTRAQKIQALCEALGMDWAGLQHHSVKGGLDIYTVAYEAMIPYLGEGIQYALDKQDDLMARVLALEEAATHN